MKKIFLFTLIFSVIFIILITLLFIFPYKLNKTSDDIIKPDNYVTRVIDGDTFEIYSGETIRLLCVDTPEKNQQGYEEAKLFLESLILNKEVNLTSSLTDKDIYDRLLRYVHINNQFVNKLVLENYGELLIIPPENCELLEN